MIDSRWLQIFWYSSHWEVRSVEPPLNLGWSVTASTNLEWWKQHHASSDTSLWEDWKLSFYFLRALNHLEEVRLPHWEPTSRGSETIWRRTRPQLCVPSRHQRVGPSYPHQDAKKVSKAILDPPGYSGCQFHIIKRRHLVSCKEKSHRAASCPNF